MLSSWAGSSYLFATGVLYPHLLEMTDPGDRVFLRPGGPAAAKVPKKAEAKTAGDQRTLEAYS